MSEVRVEARRESPTAMHLQSMLVTGNRGEDMVDLALAGSRLMLSIQRKGEPFGSRILESIPLADLVEAWVASIAATEKEGATDD